MSTEVATATNSSPVIPSKEKKRALKVSGKLKTALDLMVFGDQSDGNQRAFTFVEAARAVKMNAAAMRKALEKPHVRQYLNAQKVVFRESASAQNISRAIELRDQDENKTAAIQAIRYLDGEGSAGNRVNVGVQVNVTPGVVIDLTEPKGPPVIEDDRIIEVNPLNQQRDVAAQPVQTRVEAGGGSLDSASVFKGRGG